MANTFLTSDFMQAAAQDAAILLNGEIVAPNLVQRELEGRLAGGVPTVSKSGGSVSVKYRPVLSANLDESSAGATTLSSTDNTQQSVLVDATNYVYIKQPITTKEATYDINAFTEEIVAPAVAGMAETIDEFFIRRIAGGFARNLSGTAGTAASTAAHIVAARKVLNDNKAPSQNRVALLGTQAESNFLQLDNFVNADYGQDGPNAMREAMLARRYGISWYMDQHAGTFDQGDVAGTVLVDGAATAGATTIHVDGFTAATGTVKEGTRFTVAGTATVYTVTADTAIANNEATLPIYPALTANEDNEDAITFQTAFTEDVIFNGGAVAGAIIAPAPLMGTPSAVAEYEGMSVRVTFDSSTSGSNGAVDNVLIDAYIGCRVIRPEMGVILQG